MQNNRKTTRSFEMRLMCRGIIPFHMGELHTNCWNIWQMGSSLAKRLSLYHVVISGCCCCCCCCCCCYAHTTAASKYVY